MPMNTLPRENQSLRNATGAYPRKSNAETCRRQRRRRRGMREMGCVRCGDDM